MGAINWKRKLTSRKFWVAVIGFATTVAVVLNVDSLSTEKIVAVISSLSVLIAYIIGEGLVDSARKNGVENYPEIRIEK